MQFAICNLRLRSRAGLTLIELLVVIIILTTLVAAAIPVLAPADSDRATREATRGANTFITGAQTRAIVNRRPFGIALKRLSQDTGRAEDNGVSLEMYYVEQQPPYAGFDANSRASVALHQNNAGYVLIRFVTRGYDPNDGLPSGWDVDLFPTATIQPGDVVEIGNTRYELVADDLTSIALINGYFAAYPGRPAQIAARPINDTGQMLSIEYDRFSRPLRDGPPATGQPLQPPYWTAPMPYKILRQPTKTNDPPYQFPEGTAIDLRASGFGRENYFQYSQVAANVTYVDNADPVYVMFTPEGRVERVSYYQNLGTAKTLVNESVVDNIFLLVGKRENIPAPALASDVSLSSLQWGQLTSDEQRREKKEPINWLLGQSRWIVIGSQSGRVVSVENAFVDPAAVIAKYSTLSGEPLRSAQILAAREFTADMANLGGR